MRRTAVGRAFAVVVALWFGVAANQPMAFGVCQMSGTGAAAHQMDMPMDGMAQQSMPSHGGAPQHHHAPQQGPLDCCSCVAACCVAVAVAPATHFVAIDAERSEVSLAPRARDVIVAGAADVTIPFANGPPIA